MKLACISKPFSSEQVRIMLTGDLNAGLHRYARYYEHIHGEHMDSRVLIPEILRAFLDADREFQSWSRSGAGDQTRRISTPSTARLAGARGRAGRRGCGIRSGGARRERRRLRLKGDMRRCWEFSRSGVSTRFPIGSLPRHASRVSPGSHECHHSTMQQPLLAQLA